MSFIAVSLLLSAAYLANAGRRIATAVTARARSIAHVRAMHLRFRQQVSEREFLDSAVQATSATLLNTEHFLEKQIARAERAEAQLEELANTQKDVDLTLAREAEMRLALAGVEADLELERKRLQSDENLISHLENEIEKRKNVIVEFERDSEQMEVKLTQSRKSAEDILTEALQDKNRLEFVLEEKKKQLNEEVVARDAQKAALSDAKEQLEEANQTFDTTISHIEERRKHIESVAAEAEEVARIALKKKRNLDAAVEHEAAIGEVEDSLECIQGEQELIRTSLADMRVKEAEKDSERTDLRKKVEARDFELEQLRSKLERLENANVRVAGVIMGNAVSSTREGSEKVQSIEKVNEHKSLSCADPGNLHVSKVANSEGTKREAMPSTSSSSQEMEQLQQEKRGRGRPRKTLAVEENTKPKRGRGRPKKQVSDMKKDDDSTPKKRGRPRKNPLSVMQ